MKDVAISADGVPIYYDVQGEGTPALVFVHGWSCDRNYWDKQVSHFAQQSKVVTIDLAGHGESGLNRQSWTIEAFGHDVVAVVEQLGLEQVVLIGHSVGGKVIVEVARKIQQKVIGLVGVETFRDLEQTRTHEEIHKILAPFRANFQDTVRQFVRNNQFTPTSDPALVETIVEDMAAAPPDVGIKAADGAFRYDAKLREELQKVGKPVILINADSRPTDSQVAERYRITVEVIPGVSHFLMLEAPERFNRHLEKAVAELMVQKGSDR